MKLGVIGIGIVGSAMCKTLEFLGHKVFRYDKFKHTECNSTIEDMKEYCEAIFLCLPTPSNEDGSIDMGPFNEVLPQLMDYDGVVIIKSTVLPGTCRAIQDSTGLNIVFNPEFLTERNADMDSINPTRIVVGTNDGFPNEIVDKIYDKFIMNNVEWIDTGYESAEMSKYACNLFLAMKVSFANELFDLCEYYGANYYDIKKVLGTDKRIGSEHLNITLDRGWGGMCFPKDTLALSYACDVSHLDFKLLEATISSNEKYQGDRKAWSEKFKRKQK